MAKRKRKPAPAAKRQATVSSRYPAVDIARGIAIVMMFVFHFTFDLRFYGVVNIDFIHDPFWKNFRFVIVSSFLLLVGISLHLATRNGLNIRRYNRRLLLIISYALLVSLGSYLMFPESFIYFGILHFIAVASVIGLWFTRFYWTNIFTGLVIVIATNLFHNEIFNHIALQWIGFMTHLPYTEDYVPLAPWFGIVLIGIFVGKLIFNQQDEPAFLARPLHNPFARLLAFSGRHSLHIYLLHQPVFFGILYLIFG